jgi:hypothetical protein
MFLIVHDTLITEMKFSANFIFYNRKLHDLKIT